MRNSFRALVLTIATLVVASVAHAAPIISGDGESWSSSLAAVCTQAGSGTPCGGTTVLIDRPGVWMDDALTAPAHWVSYLDTGYFGSFLAPYAGSVDNPTGQTPIMEITESFIGAAGSAVSVRFWADDTLDVYFNGVLVQAANFTQGTCAVGPIGCEPNEYFDLNTLATGGLDSIRMVAYQTGGGVTTNDNPFGVLYTGSYTPAREDVPEPATLALCGLGLAAASVRRLRRR